MHNHSNYSFDVGIFNPDKKIDENVGKSAHIFKEEGTYPILSNKVMSRYDNYTDAMILLEAANKNSNNPLKDAMSVKSGFDANISYSELLVGHFIQNKNIDTSHSYERYWHGHLIFIKPIMYFIDYYGLRILNGIAMTIMIVLIIWQLIKKNEKLFVLPYILSILFLMPIAVAMNIQFSNCYYVMSFGLLAIILLKGKMRKKRIEVFLYIGIATAFFDLLTYPIITFGVPCVLYFFIEKFSTLKDIMKEFFKVIASWGIGYALMWSSKWILGTIITGNNVILDGLEQTNTRTTVGNTLASKLRIIMETEMQNVYYLLKTPATLLALIYLVIMIVVIVKIKKQDELSNKIIAIIPFVLISVTPFIWYAVATQHSNIHFWYTYKALVASVLSILCIPTYLYKVLKK